MQCGRHKGVVFDGNNADETIIFAYPSIEEMWCIRQILDRFYQVSGLQMNASKTVLYGLNVPNEELNLFAEVFDCKVGSFPFEYLRVPISAKSHRVSTWKPIIRKFKKKLLDELFNILSPQSWKLKVGDGSSVLFWEDIWIGVSKLRDQFPALFRISSEKIACISEIGFVDVCSNMQWDLGFVLPLDHYEEQQVQVLKIVLKDTVISPD
ncbi:uncharacterized protein [Rutidosis leptorrhynchoides]|uniref:uncharacterized protein n=1 Tax=Rutidosis leptorrhynchoides TaxID=125765 RepID=UPI003A99D783